MMLGAKTKIVSPSNSKKYRIKNRSTLDRRRSGFFAEYAFFQTAASQGCCRIDKANFKPASADTKQSATILLLLHFL